jgi:hypothetical protein
VERIAAGLRVGNVSPDTVEDSRGRRRVGALGRAVQETQKRADGANPKTALRAFLGVELQAPAGEPTQIALDVM